jgi:hypothetical protein
MKSPAREKGVRLDGGKSQSGLGQVIDLSWEKGKTHYGS